jgi:DNA primase
MKVHQAGFPEVVALMGCSLSKTQETLMQPFKSIIIFLDGDDAGREAAKLIGAGLCTRIS